MKEFWLGSFLIRVGQKRVYEIKNYNYVNHIILSTKGRIKLSKKINIKPRYFTLNDPLERSNILFKPFFRKEIFLLKICVFVSKIVIFGSLGRAEILIFDLR